MGIFVCEDRCPVAIAYTGRGGRHSDRTILPYGIVAHSGRWYVTGHDSRSGQVRTFRLDRITRATLRPGSFNVPPGFDPTTTVLESLAATLWRHEVSIRVHGDAASVQARLPTGIAIVEPLSHSSREPSCVELPNTLEAVLEARTATRSP
ncbi:MAG: WYL domain-containing protein [Sciscionella sp.]